MVGYARHPFYERNRSQTFLAYRDGEICGRIAAILNVGHIERYNDPCGFFGFFECRDDQEAANALFDACRDWFAAQGIGELRGPMNPSLNYMLGLLIDGFDSPPTFMMTYNPPYYERLLENYGFRKTQDLYAFWGHISMLPAVSEKLRPLCHRIIRRYNARIPAAGQITVPGGRDDLSVALQSLVDKHMGIRAHVRGRDGAPCQRASTPDRAGDGHCRGG